MNESHEHGALWHAEWFSPVGGTGIRTYTCCECGALVHPDRTKTHAAWHERLRKAVDETGTLG